MTLPKQILKEYSLRLISLASEGFTLMHRFQNAPPSGANERKLAERNRLITEFYTWKTNASAILSSLLPASSPQRLILNDVFGADNPQDALPRICGVLAGVKDDLGRGFLGDLRSQVEANLAADYMN
jgi:hypothetical protein